MTETPKAGVLEQLTSHLEDPHYPDPDKQEERWKASVRRYFQSLRQANLEAWRAHHLKIAGVHAGLAEEHWERAIVLSAPESATGAVEVGGGGVG